MKTIYFLPVLLISLWCKAQDGLYPYAEKNKWGLTNKKKTVVMEPQFDSIHLFEGDYARVENSNKIGLVNRSGNVVYSCSYAEIPFVASNGMAIARVPAKGYVLLDPSTGKQKGTLVFELTGLNPMSKAANVLIAKKEGSVGLVSMATGEPITKKFPYDDAEFFDLESLSDYVIVSIKGKYGVVEALTGKEVIPAAYSEIKGVDDDKGDMIRATTDDEREVYFDIHAKRVSAAVVKDYQERNNVADDEAPATIEEQKKDIHIVKMSGGKWRVVLEYSEFRQRGHAIDSTDFTGYSLLEYMSYKNNKSKLKAVKDGKTGVIDMKGNVLVPLIYDDVAYREDNLGQYAFIATKVGNRFGVIPCETMKELKKPVLADVIDEDENRGALLVRVASGSRGYMDKNTGEIYIPGYKD